ncbi:hypothetical protein WJX75_009409 [Coccomyxa subellipsoidea]|uniref:BZIP domain-containing protein n=1 Tax=Coccomyxa subellipsoidea TaxID=248742 RepID=A0ABR2YGZ6_9CHLO
MPFPEELELHSFLDLNLPVTDLDPFSAHTDWLNTLPSPNHSADVSENSLNGSGSSHYPFDDLFVATDTFPVGSKLDTPAAESPARIADFPLIPSQGLKREAKSNSNASRGSADGSGTPKPKGHRTAAAMERNRRGARKFRERQKQKFMDLTNRVEMLETELIAMKLCKLKMEADKTQVELHAKQMEKTLSALQAAHSSGEAEGDDAAEELGSHAVTNGSDDVYISVPDSNPMPADLHTIKGLSYTQAFGIFKSYVAALRQCLSELEQDSASQPMLQRIGTLVQDLTVFASRMQATSTVPLWQLYHKQECCLDPTTSFEFERDLLSTLDLGDDQRAALVAAQRRYRGALRALAKERATINAAMAAAAAPGKDGLKKAHEAMWALKGSLAKEPRYTEAFLSACMRALMPLQTAKLIVAFFPRTVWPDFSTICASIALDAGDNTVLDGPV